MEESLERERRNSIGRCDVCGIVTHQLSEGLCVVCKIKCNECKDCSPLQKFMYGIKCKARSLFQ